MRTFRGLTSLFARLCLCACGGIIFAGMALADVQESRFDISSDEANVALDVQGISRRAVLDRLFANTGIEFNWLNPSVADELISGKFNGTLSGIARQLLAQTDFVLVYDGADKVRIARVLIVGRARSGQSAARTAGIEAAMRLPAGVMAALPMPAPGGVLTPMPMRPPAGVMAPSPMPAPGGVLTPMPLPASGSVAVPLLVLMPADAGRPPPLPSPGTASTTPMTPLPAIR
jgi:hypothetical protein